MFDFSELGKLTKYNWINDVSLSLPKGNKGVYTDKEYNNIMTGAILCLISAVVIALMGVLTASGLFNLFGDMPEGNLGLKISIDIILIVILCYVVLNKNKNHNSWFEYIIMIYLIIRLVESLCNVFGVLLAIMGGLMYALIMTATYAINIVGVLFMIIGCLDFSKRLRGEYDSTHMVKEFSTMESPDTSTVPYPEVVEKTCPYCGNKTSSDAKFCKTCGANVE